MDPVEEINFREEIERIVLFLVDIFHRIRERNEDGSLFQWRQTSHSKKRKSVVRWLADCVPCRSNSETMVYNNKTLWQRVFKTRSLVRELGNRLPIQPSKRPYFYMLHQADLQSTKLRGMSSRVAHSTPCKNSIISPGSILWEGDSCLDNLLFDQSVAATGHDTVRKITALEDELNKLRAQIAGFVLKQDDPVMPVFSPPTTAGAIPPPPAPPPPPPLPSSVIMRSTNILQTPKKDSSSKALKDSSVLDMTAILKDLTHVKLKAVQRSPGGTPVRRAPLKIKRTDPASIIADALKNKFAKSRIAAASPDKENIYSPGNSFSNTPSPKPQFRKPRKPKPLPRASKMNTDLEYQTPASIPLRV